MRRWCSIFLALPLALAACVPGAAEYTKTEAPAEPHLYGSQRVLTIAFAPGSARLAASQAGRLAQFVRNGDIRPADRVEIAAAGRDTLAQGRVAAIAREFLRYHIVATSRPLVGVPRNDALVLIGRYAVMLPPCPNWSKSAATDFTNETSSNFGCADAINLGTMVANPADLAGGRMLGAASGKTAVSAVDRYLSDQVTPLITTDLGPASTSYGSNPLGSAPSPTSATATDTVP
jgi:pilus assembly protein CpaD